MKNCGNFSVVLYNLKYAHHFLSAMKDNIHDVEKVYVMVFLCSFTDMNIKKIVTGGA